MTDNNVTPIVPQPSDQEIQQYLTELRVIDQAELHKLVVEMRESQHHNIDQELPVTFAYGQAINKLRTQLKEDLVHMLAAALWELTNHE